MTSTKELFASGINYILRDIADNTSLIETSTEYIERIKAKQKFSSKEQRLIERIQKDISQIKEQLKKNKQELKEYMDYFGYTESDFKRYNLHPATDEEIERDYQNDLKESGFDEKQGKGKYTRYDHEQLVKRVNEFNKLHDLPVISF